MIQEKGFNQQFHKLNNMQSLKFELAPSYASLLLAIKHHEKYRSRIFDILWASFHALERLLKECPPRFVVQSLADFQASINSINACSNNLLTSVTRSGTKLIMDCGGLERLYAADQYFVEPLVFNDPVANLEAQLSLRPNIATLLDDMRNSRTLEDLPMSKLKKLLKKANEDGIELMVVVHSDDLTKIKRLQGLELLNYINYVALPDKELRYNYSILADLKILGKKLVIFGLDDLSLEHLSEIVKHGVILGDLSKWSTCQLEFENEGQVLLRTFKEIPNSEELEQILYENLLKFEKIERNLTKSSR
jgi:hypothetical protein